MYSLFCYCMNRWNGYGTTGYWNYLIFSTASSVHWIAQYQKCSSHKMHQEDWKTRRIHREPQGTSHQCMVLDIKSSRWNSVPHNVLLELVRAELSETMGQLAEGVPPLLAQLLVKPRENESTLHQSYWNRASRMEACFQRRLWKRLTWNDVFIKSFIR